MKTKKRKIIMVLAIAVVSSFAVCQANAKPNPLNNVYFGEQHLHTSASPDAFAIGTRSTWRKREPGSLLVQ